MAVNLATIDCQNGQVTNLLPALQGSNPVPVGACAVVQETRPFDACQDARLGTLMLAWANTPNGYKTYHMPPLVLTVHKIRTATVDVTALLKKLTHRPATRVKT